MEHSHKGQRRDLRKIEDEVREGGQGISSLLGMLVCVASGIQSHHMFCRRLEAAVNLLERCGEQRMKSNGQTGTSADGVKEGGQAKTKMTVLEEMRTGCVPKGL